MLDLQSRSSFHEDQAPAPPMHLVQILLPIFSNAGQRHPQALYARVRQELLRNFSGLTTYTRAPLDGLWCDDGTQPVLDELIIYEVMTEDLNLEWWQAYRRSLEQLFGQKELVIRAHPIQRL